jgi:phosphatidylethanolamine-binding protein (PEBP) family uncharacterized protein
VLCAAPTPSRAAARRPPAAVVAVLAGVLLGSAACGSSGRDLRDVPPGITAPPRTESAVGQPPSTGFGSIGTGSAVDGLLTLSSPAFGPGGAMPEENLCGGESPALGWVNVPPSALELALVAREPGDDGPLIWVVSGISPSTSGVGADVLPPGAVAHDLDGVLGWDGPCPPAGETATVELTLYALPQPLGLPPEATGREVADALADRAASSQATYTLLVVTAAAP